MTTPPPAILSSLEVIVRAAPRRGRPPAFVSPARIGEAVVLALADSLLEHVAAHGADPQGSEALMALEHHLVGSDRAPASSATLLRPDHHGGLAFRLDGAIAPDLAAGMERLARRFRGNARFAAIAIEVTPWRASSPPARPSDASLGERVIVLEKEPGGLCDLRDSLRICEALRNAVMSRSPVQPVPEWIGGHRADGSPSTQDHAAFVALPEPSVDGGPRLVGAAILVPRGVGDEEVERSLLPALDDAVHGPLRLWDRRSPELAWRLRRRLGGAACAALEAEAWRGGDGGARRWASVTPVMMDRHGSRPSELRDAIARSCARLGLPPPVSVQVGADAFLAGVPRSGSFPMVRRDGRRTRQQWHAEVEFDREVRGPIVLGAGRYRGQGLMVPLSPTKEDHSTHAKP